MARLAGPARPPAGRRPGVGDRSPIGADGTTRGAARELIVATPECVPGADTCEPDPAGRPKPASGAPEAGRCQAPGGEYLLPENSLPGDPPSPGDVECMSFLLYGGETAGGEPSTTC